MVFFDPFALIIEEPNVATVHTGSLCKSGRRSSQKAIEKLWYDEPLPPFGNAALGEGLAHTW